MIAHDVDCCGGTGRVVYLDMTHPNTNCPSGWNMTNYNIRTCGRASDGYDTCDSVFFPVSEGKYSQVWASYVTPTRSRPCCTNKHS